MKSNTFGLDIGTTSIKVVWLNRENNVITYNTALTYPAPAQGMQSESPFDQQETAQLINKLVIDAKIATNYVNIALPDSNVFTKVIEMPNMKEKELSSAIYWEAEQYIPAPLDTMSLDYSILSKPVSNAPEQKMQVLLVAAPLKLINRYQTILEMAGLTVVSVETEILSIIRGTVIDSSRFPTSLILNIGAFNSSLCIIKNGILVFTYYISLGGVAMSRAIASDFGLNPIQAEEYKKSYGLSDKQLDGKVRKAIEPILTVIIGELKKAITYYKEKYTNESPITQILVTGGSANMQGLNIYIAENIGIQTVTANPWSMLSIGNVPKLMQVRGTEFTVAVGLALKEYE